MTRRLLHAAALLCVAPLAAAGVGKWVPNAPRPLGWSAPGHEITGAVASAFLTASAASQVASILQPGETLESVGPWADTVRSNPAFSSWSPALHFINTPDWECAFTPASDCGDSRCLYGAILNYTARATKMTGEQQYEALKFLDHFMGDISQPLHVSFASDYGGNDIKGSFLGTYTNLHHVWDFNILDTRITNDFAGDQDSFISYLVQQIKGPWAANATVWTSCVQPGSSQCIVEWASETAGLGCNKAYKDQDGNIIPNDFTLGTPYYTNTIPVVEMQLAKGGLRLAGLLNAMWSSEEDLVAMQ